MIEIVEDSSSQSIDVFVADSSSTTGAGLTGLAYNTSGLVAEYRRGATGTLTAISLATQTVGGAWTSGGFAEIGNGLYRLDLPDAVVATGVPFATVMLRGAANMAPVPVRIALVPERATAANQAAIEADTQNIQTRLPASLVSGRMDVSVGAYQSGLAPMLSGATVVLDASQPNYAPATNADMTTLLGRLTLSRAGYLDNLNVGGPVASQADINALNQSASRRVLLVTVPQYERPESGSASYTIEARTFDGDGAAVNADSTPTLTATGGTSGDLSGNLGTATNPATGVYRWQYTVANNATQEQIRFDLSATISSSTFTLATYSQVVDLVSATWTSDDANKLTAIHDKLPSADYLLGTASSDGSGYSTINVAAVVSGMQAVADDFKADVSALPTAEQVWTYTTRVLTAGDNIALAKGTGITGFNDLDAIGIRGAVGLASANLATLLAALQTIADRIDDTLEDNAGTYRFTEDSLALAPAGGGGGSGTVSNITTAALNQIAARLAARSITVASAALVDGGAVRIVQGDDYLAADSRALSLANTAGTWPDLTSATIVLRLKRESTIVEFAGSVVTPTGTGQKVQIPLATDDTAALDDGQWSWQVKATLSGGAIVTLGTGSITVIENIEAPE